MPLFFLTNFAGLNIFLVIKLYILYILFMITNNSKIITDNNKPLIELILLPSSIDFLIKYK